MTDVPVDLLAQIPDLIAARIRQGLPALRTCEGRAGRFDVTALQKRGIAAPAVLVSTLRLSQASIASGPMPEFLVEIGAFVVTKDQLGLSRDAAAAGICQTLLRLLPETNWGIDAMGAAQAIEALPLITTSEQSAGASLWAVTWRQPITLVGASLRAPQPLEIYWGLSPEIGADHVGQYEQVTP